MVRYGSGKPGWGSTVRLLHLIAALLVAAAIISFVLSALGFVLAGAFKLLPGVLLVLTIIFFAQGGHVDIRLPENGNENKVRAHVARPCTRDDMLTHASV